LVSRTGKNYNYIGEDLVKKKKFLDLNYKVKIIEGKYENLKGIIIKISENEEEYSIELANGQILKCLEHELIPLKENEEEKKG
jgi:transcription antitermination factor NusG